jgi:outer membrane immunogenic protein
MGSPCVGVVPSKRDCAAAVSVTRTIGGILRKIVFGSIALIIATMRSALGDDIPAPVLKAPVAAPASPYNWSGFYAGGSLGGRWSNSNWTSTCTEVSTGLVALFCNTASGRLPQGNPASFDSATVRAGGYFGYNWQVSPLWVLGVEGDIAWGNSSKTVRGIPGSIFPGGSFSNDQSSVKEGWDGSARARIGFLATPTWLLYVTGGPALQNFEINANCTAPTSNWCTFSRNETASWTRLGWTIGGGVETKLWGNWLGRIEYRYADYGSVSHAFFANTIDQIGMTQSLTTQTVLLGLAYKF